MIFKMAATAILDFQKFEILMVDTLEGGMCVILPNFIKIGQTVAEIWRFNGFFFKTAAVRHLGFVGRLLGSPTTTT